MNNNCKKVISFLLTFSVVVALFTVVSISPVSAKIYTEKVVETFDDATLASTLSYTDVAGNTLTPQLGVNDNFPGDSAIVWDKTTVTGAAGEIHTRLSIDPEYTFDSKTGKLSDFSFSMPLSKSKYYPVYVLLGQKTEGSYYSISFGGHHGNTYLGYGVNDPTTFTGQIGNSGSVFEPRNYTGLLPDEVNKVLVTYTVTLTYDDNGSISKADFSAYKPAAAGVDGSTEKQFTKLQVGSIDLSAFYDVDFAISCGKTTANGTYLTNLEMNYSADVMSTEWISEVSADENAANYLNYTKADGITIAEPKTELVGGKNAIVYEPADRDGRINISNEYDGAALNKISFKTLAFDLSRNKFAPFYMMLGETTPGTVGFVQFGGYRVQGTDIGLATKNNGFEMATVASSSIGNDVVATTTNGLIYPTPRPTTASTDAVNSEAGNVWLDVTLVINDANSATLTISKPETEYLAAWSASDDIDTSTITNPYYAISVCTTSANNVNSYITDIHAEYNKLSAPEITGGTITISEDPNDQNLRVNTTFDYTPLDGYTPVDYGFVYISKASLKNADDVIEKGYIGTGLDNNDIDVADISKQAVNGIVPEQYYAYITGSHKDDFFNTTFVVRAYVTYEDAEGNKTVIYSENNANDSSQGQKQIVKDGVYSGKVSEIAAKIYNAYYNTPVFAAPTDYNTDKTDAVAGYADASKTKVERFGFLIAFLVKYVDIAIPLHS